MTDTLPVNHYAHTESTAETAEENAVFQPTLMIRGVNSDIKGLQQASLI